MCKGEMIGVEHKMDGSQAMAMPRIKV